MSDLDTILDGTEPQPETARSTPTIRTCKRHRWVERRGHPVTDEDGDVIALGALLGEMCAHCFRTRDPIRSRRGKSAARFGKDQERRIEKKYGPTKVGEFGDAIDLRGASFKWQSKATHADPPAWLSAVNEPVGHEAPKLVTEAAAAMAPLARALAPLVIVTHVSRTGTRDWVWVTARDWGWMHGNPEPLPDAAWLVMSGDRFLAIHGRDDERTEAAA